MRKVVSVLLVLLAFFLYYHAYANAYSIDGSLTDWGISLNDAVSLGYLDSNVPAKASVDYVTEDNTDSSHGWVNVGPGWSNGNNYDAEAIYFDNDSTYGYIAIVTGVGPGSYWKAGDIGLNVTPDTAYLVDQDSSGTGGSNTTTPYEYGIALVDSDSDGIPDKGTLKRVTRWYNVRYDDPNTYDFTASDPWAILDGTTNRDVPLSYSSAAINGHYVIETRFLLSDLWLNPGDEFNIHWTMKCGNDFLTLEAKVDPVPEPGTILLVGTGLIGLALGRKKKKV